MFGCNDSRNNNDNNQDYNNDDQADAHLHVLPPHLFSHSVGSAAEPLSGYSKVVCLILKGIETFTTLRHFVDILTHHTNGVVDLSLQSCSPLVSIRRSAAPGGGTTSGDIRVIWRFAVGHGGLKGDEDGVRDIGVKQFDGAVNSAKPSSVSLLNSEAASAAMSPGCSSSSKIYRDQENAKLKVAKTR